ncbi:hypothetical protein [Nocardioides jishulii]|uniref:Uncharacterized protein n=1 Tax=Nocardioides jishulii TaxID=2575440 RepID=A0A4U2YIP0_9ACTN|nr:hypothetical protein [Nocardioides jishulii]QCX28086.1 hypothetical protein FCL41_11580 [Nocardioides jishulii]TKI60750.1 hypothetical protein FC770_14655 [Nocardioides jishulii]
MTVEWTASERQIALAAEEFEGEERRLIDTFLHNRRRARFEAEPVTVDDLRRLTEIPEEDRKPYGTVREGWRFGHLSRSGAIVSPWSPSLEWPREGVRAVCTPTSERAAPDDGRVFHGHHDAAPVQLCSCGVYYAKSLAYLVHHYGGMWPDVFYQVQAWGGDELSPEDRHETAGERRARYVRVKPGGRMLVGPVAPRRGGGKRRTGAYTANLLRHHYGARVEVVKADGAVNVPPMRAWLYTLSKRYPLA